LGDLLFDFDGIVGQEIVQYVIVDLAFQSLVVPGDVETEDHPVILDVLFQSIVGVSSPQFDFEILLVLPKLITGTWCRGG